LVEVHEVVTYEQEKFMKPFIDFNTAKRAQAKNDFEKDMFKLMNNSVYGKTMESVRKRKNIDVLKTDTKKFMKWVADPGYKGRKTIAANFVVAERGQRNILLNKPIYVGASVLDLSKLHMTGFWYDYIRPLYPSAKLHYTDTDSLVYTVESPTEPDFHGRKGSMFDTSDLPKNHPLYSADNKKVMGMFKPENKDIPMKEFVAMRSKMYAALLDELAFRARGDKSLKLEIKKAAGISYATVKKEMKFEHYKNVLMTGTGMSHNQINFKSKSHQMYTVKSVKSSLSPFDSKRYILPNGIDTLPYGHKDIPALAQ
jgi:hypothetical protein